LRQLPPPPAAAPTAARLAPSALQAYANARGVGLVGDMPIYVGGQSADVWAHRQLFELQPDGKPALVRCVHGALGCVLQQPEVLEPWDDAGCLPQAGPPCSVWCRVIHQVGRPESSCRLACDVRPLCCVAWPAIQTPPAPRPAAPTHPSSVSCSPLLLLQRRAARCLQRDGPAVGQPAVRLEGAQGGGLCLVAPAHCTQHAGACSWAGCKASTRL